ncbi:MAG: MATE family efflux transporter, partial [Sedimentibacter sp.]
MENRIKQTQENIMGTEKITKLIFKLAGPAILAQVINILYNIVDRMYVGHIEGIGPLALTALG